MASDRLMRFRQYMAAFEGAADPAKSLAHGHYVHAPGQLLVDQIAGRIALRPNSTHLLVGGIGSGKTTQLLVAKNQLEAIDDLAICYVDVSRHTDISQIEPGTLMTIVGLELFNLLPQELHGNFATEIGILRNIAYGYSESKTITVNTFTALMRPFEESRSEQIQHRGILISAEHPGLLESVQKIFEALIDHDGKKIILFCDGLDRVEDVDRFAKAIQSDIYNLKQIGIGIVIVAPMLFNHSIHQDTKDLIDYTYYQPCFDVEHSPEAQLFFSHIIAKRLPENTFFGSSTLDRLVQSSGGVMRDLITLTQAAIEEVYLSGGETLELEHVEKAVQTLARTKMLGISKEDLLDLQHYLNSSFVLSSPESFQLLTSRRILEYREPRVRYAVHPAIVPLLQPVAASA
jgi:hypothetical protein